MDMIYTWCSYNGITWFYNPKQHVWWFEGKGRKIFEHDIWVKNYPRSLLKDLELIFS